MATLLTLQTFTGTNGAALPGGAGTGVVNGVIPTGGSALIQSNQAMLKTGSAGGYAGTDRVSQIANITSTANAVYKGTFRWSGDEVYPQVYVRGTNTQLDTAGGYRVALDPVGNTWEVASVVAFSQTPIVAATSFTWQTGVDYWIIFGAVGTDLRFVLWQDGQPQPAYATVGSPTAVSASFTNSTVTAAGTVGVTVGGGALGVRSMSFDNLEVFDAFPPVIPPIPFPVRRRTSRALPAARRRRPAGPVPAASAVLPPKFVPQLRRNRITKRGLPLRQGFTAFPPAPQPIGPMFDRPSRPPVPAMRRLRRFVSPIPPQAAPQFSPIPMVGVTARARALQQRRPRGAGQPPPAQPLIVVPIYPPGAARARARALVGRRPRGAGVPVQQQVVVPVVYVPNLGITARARLLLARRPRGTGGPVLAQGTPPAVPYAPGAARARARVLARRPARVATAVPIGVLPPAAQALSGAIWDRARALLAKRRRPGVGPVPPQERPPLPGPVGRRRPAAAPVRRRPVARPPAAAPPVPFFARTGRSSRTVQTLAPRRRRISTVPYVGFVPVPGDQPGGVLIGSGPAGTGPVGSTSSGPSLIGAAGGTYVVGLTGAGPSMIGRDR
jgi:hypothetical protein